jgi:hypothetical protein
MSLKNLFFILLIFPVTLFGQKSKPWNKALYDAMPYHYGFAFTGGIIDFSVSHVAYSSQMTDSVYSVEGQAGAVFGASMVANKRLNENWDLRFIPGLYFGQRNLNYLYSEIINEVDTAMISHTMKIETTLLQFPLLLKYRAQRQNNYRPYVVFGANYALDLAAKKKIKEEEQPKIRLNRNDVMLEMGFGVDYYLTYFKFSTELRFSYGLLNVVNYDNTEFTTVFDRLGSKMVTLLIYFE